MPIHTRSQRILIVEDESELQALVREALQSLNVELQVAGSLAEAERAIQSGDFDVILSDQQLEGEPDGLKLYEICQQLCPASRFILMSAYTEQVFSGLLKTGMSCPAFLAKPFRVQEVCKIVESMLISRAA